MIVVALVLPGHFAMAGDQCGTTDFDEKSAPVEYVGNNINYTLEQPFGGVSSVASFAAYVQLVYQFGLGIIGIMATVLIMFGGVKWISAAGNESIIGDAKEIIIAAVTGLTIALLSYIILLIINPQLVNISLNIIKIPVSTACSYADPETEVIPNITGLNGNGRSLCKGAVTALEHVADIMVNGTDGAGPLPGTCPGCVLDVSSGVRTHEDQAKLRSCYDRAVASGVTDGGSCPADCTTCNLAEKVCCSEHEHAKAVDIGLTKVGLTDYAATTAGFRKTKYNNGGAGGAVNLSGCTGTPDEALCKTEVLTNTVMTATGAFKGISQEWWHFNFQGDCGSQATATTCTTNATTGKADNAYCLTAASGSTPTSYSYATCTNSAPVCTSPASMVNPGTCGATTSNHFSITSATVVPACVAN